jgi:hypothetical protein
LLLMAAHRYNLQVELSTAGTGRHRQEVPL